MKNILARGGIEFLAVLLGISASLWIDNNNKKEDLGLQRDETYQLLENQTDSLLSYTNNMLNYYELQGKRFGIIIDQWESIQFDTIKNQNDYVRGIWAAFSNAFYPDFSTYETLVNSVWNGMNGMPAKGLCIDCTKEEIEIAVQYMLDVF